MLEEWTNINKNCLIVLYSVCILFSDCSKKNNRPFITYERQSTDLNTKETFTNVIYMPTISSSFILDEDMAKEASGLYKIKKPTQKKIDQLNESGYTVFQNEHGEIIVLCTKILQL